MKDNNLKKVLEMAMDINVAMMVTEDESGALRSRPMSNAAIDIMEPSIWFFTDIHSPKIAEIKKDHVVNLAYAKPESNDYLSISGQAQVINDNEKIDQFWEDDLKEWFPQGKNSDRIALLKVTPSHADYWDSASSKLVALYRKVEDQISEGKHEVYESGKVDI